MPALPSSGVHESSLAIYKNWHQCLSLLRFFDSSMHSEVVTLETYQQILYPVIFWDKKGYVPREKSQRGNFLKSRVSFWITIQTILDRLRSRNISITFYVFAIFLAKNGPKQRFYKEIRSKKFFRKILLPTIGTFYCRSFELSYTGEHLTLTELFPSWQIHTPLLPYHRELMSLFWTDTRTGIDTTDWSGISVLGDDWSYDSYLSKKRYVPREKW